MRKVDVVAAMVLDRFVSWRDARRQRQGNWVRYSRIARLQEEPADRSRESEGSTIRMPATKGAITMAMDNLYQMLFGSSNFFDIRGRSDEDNPTVLKHYLDYLLDKDKVKYKFRKFLNDLCTYGTGICRVNVRAEQGRHVRPEFEWVSIFDFFIEPQAAGIEDAEGVIVRKVQKIYRLKKMQSEGLVSGVELIAGSFTAMDEDRQIMLKKAGIDAGLENGDVTLFEYWGWMDEELLALAGYGGRIENGGAEVVCLVANGSVVLRLAENPFLSRERPFLKESFEEIPGQFYGLGICDIADGPQKALDATVRSRIDNKSIGVNMAFAIDIDRIMIDKDGKIFPGKTFFTRGNPRDVIQQLDIRDVTHGSYREAQEFERYIHEGTGISPILAGVTGSKSLTATEASIAQSQSSMRLKMVAMQVEENVTVEVLRWFYMIALQFFDQEEVIRVTNADLMEVQSLVVSEQSISGDYDFVPIGVMNMTARNNFVKIMDFLTRTANQFDIQVTNRAYLLREAYKALGFNDADIVFKTNSQQGVQMLENTIGTKGVSPAPKVAGTENLGF